jgi:two-component system chemotaxis response regulator CheY
MTKKVLMVDDSKTTRDMVSFTLRRAGYEVLLAEDGQRALAVLGSSRVDCVITDLNMPGMDGIGLIRELRASAVHRTTPILMLTTDSGAVQKEEGTRAGANGWLCKPFHPTSLLESVTRIA